MANRHLLAILAYAIALCGMVPLLPWLAMMPRLALAIGLAAGIWQSLRGPWPIRPWLLNAIAVPTIVVYGLQIERANPGPAVANALAVMLSVRLLGEKTSRHYLQLYALSLFCLAASSLFSLSPSFLLYLGLLLFLTAMALVLITFHDHDPHLCLRGADLRRVLSAGLLIPLGTAPLLVFFFPLLPRTKMPLWNFGEHTRTRLTGFTDKVEPGATSAVEESNLLVFRVEMPRQAGASGELYWREIVLNRLEGTRWRRDPQVPPETVRYNGPRLRQEIYLEPGLSGFLPGLDVPVTISAPRRRHTADATFTTPSVSERRLHYRAESALGGRLTVEGGIDRDFYLRLPELLSPRLKQLADGLRAQAEGSADRLALLERHFQSGRYRYSLRGLPTGPQALDEFLFGSRRGNCEFFAAAFALVARAAGIPARLVGGYLGGEYNDLGGYYLVRERMAHAWVEVFIEGQGWLRIDPSRFAENAAEVWADRRPGLLRRLRLVLDSLDHAWNRSVLTYDFERQVEMAVGLGRRFQGLNLEHRLAAMLVPCLAAGLGLGLVVLLLKRRRLFASKEARLLDDFYRHLERDCGLSLTAGQEGVLELAARSGSHRAREFAERYAAAIYHDRGLTTAELTRLRALLAAGLGEHGK